MLQRPPLSIFFLIFFLNIFGHCCKRTTGTGSRTLIHVGVILDLESWNGNMSHHCISMAQDDFYRANEHYRTKLVLHTGHADDVYTAVLTASDMLEKLKVKVIVGPQKSKQADIVAEFGNKAHVPTISFSATSPSLSSDELPYFIRMVQNDADQLDAITALIKYFQWKEVVLVYEETDFGNGIIPYLVDAFKTDIRMPHQSSIPPDANDDQILEELDRLSGLEMRVFIVHMSSPLGPRFFLQAKAAGMMSDNYVWIITEELTNLLGSMEHPELDSMLGVVGVKAYIPNTTELGVFRERLGKVAELESNSSHNSNIFCLHAYDTIWAVAMAVENVLKQYSDEETLVHISSEHGISRVGPQLLNEILQSKFRGLSGEIGLVDGQLQCPVFEIVNVNHVEHHIGYWNLKFGISQKPYVETPKILQPVIWPGGSSTVPVGWVMPGHGKKRKIGYPVKDTFTEFVNKEFNHSSNKTVVGGYCIDIFKMVMEALPDVVYDFVPFDTNNDEIGCNYNNLVYQVFLQKYDIVVGDITITSARSRLVDFSHPYTTGGVQMVIPSTYDKKNYLLIGLKPFSLGVWIFSLIILPCIITAMIEIFEFGGLSRQDIVPSLKLIPQVLLSPFRTVDDNVIVRTESKFVIWIFVAVVAILGELYFQALGKLLFEDNTQLKIVDANDFKNNNDFVGYQKGSLVPTILQQLNIHESKLKAYNSLEEYDEALRKGSKNGGVSAIFDEIPYIKLLINKYCGKYRSIGPVYKSEGFGFVSTQSLTTYIVSLLSPDPLLLQAMNIELPLPKHLTIHHASRCVEHISLGLIEAGCTVFQKGDPLAPEVTRELLPMMEGTNTKYAEIESKWLESNGKCPDPPEAVVSSSTLTFAKITGLFVLIGIFLVSALLLHLAARDYNISTNWVFKTLTDIYRLFRTAGQVPQLTAPV